MAKATNTKQSFEDILADLEEIKYNILQKKLEVQGFDEQILENTLILKHQCAPHAEMVKAQTGILIDDARISCLREMKQLKNHDVANELRKLQDERDSAQQELENYEITHCIMQSRISFILKNIELKNQKFKVFQVN